MSDGGLLVKRLDELTLRCRGIVIYGAGKPIVLCAVDWIGIHCLCFAPAPLFQSRAN